MNMKRLFCLYTAFLVVTGLIAMRFYRIAERNSKAQNVLSGQYTRRLDAVSRKGLILDRNGTLISDSITGYRTIVNPGAIDPEEYYETAQALYLAGGKETSYYIEKLYRKEPFCADTARRVEPKYGACFPIYSPRNDSFLCHVLGYRNRDGVGMSGFMKAYGEYLSDYTAASVAARYEADATGAVMTDGYFEIHDSGYDEKDGMTLTIDETIQKIAETICDETMERGAVVVEDVRSGALAAVCSRPSYDPTDIADYLDSEKGELVNRAFSAFTPGSVFKTVVAAAALEKDPTVLERTYECTGAIDIYGTVIRCHNRNGHGKLTMQEAFAQSCNPYFIDLGLSLGKEAISDTAKKMGIFCYDNVSLLPCDKGTFPEEKTILPAALANLSVGQGDILATPIEICGMISTAVTGEYHKPSLVKSFSNENDTTPYEKEGKTVLKEETVSALRSMFISCVEDGTGYRAAGETTCGGKTATAQSGQKKDGKEVIHSWFAGYFPTDEPRYAICVFCDGNGENSTHPSLIFKMLAEKIEKAEQNTSR